MLDDALAYPRRGEDVLWRHLVGAGLMVLGLFLIPVFFVYGYLVRVVRQLAEGDPEPPAWGNWVELFVDGVKYVAVMIIYGIPTAIFGGLIVVFAVGLGFGILAERPGVTAGFAIALAGLGLLTAVVGLLTGYLLPGAIVNFAREDDFAAAFHLRTIAGNAFSWPYFVAWLRTIAVGIVLGLVAAVLLVVFLVGLLVFFYLVVATYLLTDGYLEAAGAAPSGRD